MISIINEWNPIKAVINKVAAAGQASVDKKLAAGGADIAKERLNKFAGSGLMAKWAGKTKNALQDE